MGIKNREDLRNAINGHQLARCLQVIAELGIADLLVDGPKSPEYLARATQTQEDALFRLLRSAVSAGVFVYDEEGCFRLNEPAQWLCQDQDGSLRAMAVLAGQQHFPAWAHLPESIRTGRPAFDLLHGMSVWDYRSTRVGAGETFDAAMSALAATFAGAVIAAYDFSGAHCVVDVGGGHGAFLVALLQRYTHLSGVLFDQAPAVARFSERLDCGLRERGAGVAGDFLAPLPAMGDIYVLQRVLHDWDEGMAIRILVNCRAAMKAGQKVLVVERVMDATAPTTEAALADLLMLVMNGGRERTGADFRRLLEASGLRLERVIPTQSVLSIVEGCVV
ncbi:MAG: methyltransferase [Anaerolineales bacterium]|nr:methyltransferase [Anaerolineales bacterium]